MDHQTFAQLLGNYGEFVGSIAVLATLGYLIVQLKQNTKAVRASIFSQFSADASTIHEILINNADTINQIFSSGRELDDFSPSERTVFHSLFMLNMNLYETSYLNYLEGNISENIFEAKHRNMIAFFRRPYHEEYWPRVCERSFDRRFIEYVNTSVLPIAPETKFGAQQ